MSTSKDHLASTSQAPGSYSGTRRVPYDRMPYPIGLCWVTAHRAQQTLTVYKSAETVVRVMFSMVLADVLDLDWPDDATRKLRDGPAPKRGLDRMSFGTRVDLLRTVVQLHEGAKGRVLPDLRQWWSRADGSIGAIVTERNTEGHDGALAEESPDDAKARLAQFLRTALWLQQVQLVHVETASRSRGRYSGSMVRLQGAAPYHGLDHEVRGAWRAEFEPGWVYLGNAEGTEWTLNPFLSARDRAVAVLDAIDRSGRLEFVDPGSKRGETREQTDGVPVPGNRWKLAPWRKFLESRQVTSRSREWRFREDDPDPLLLLDMPADPTLQPDAVVGDYRLVQLLGEGASAAVWEAVELASGASWALKVLKPDVADVVVESGRFVNEFMTLRRLHALGCRRLLGPVEKITIDVGDAPRIMLRMPLLAGSLAQRAREMRDAGEAPDVPTVARWGVQGLEALVDVHKHIQAHRDIKPSNFLVDHNGEIVLADFGIVRDESRPKQWTGTGESLGSDPYMAPEQRNNASAATAKADVYGLAATLHELLSGACSPVPGKGLEGELGALIHEMGRADPDERPDAAQALERMRAIARKGVVDAAPGPAAASTMAVAAKDGASEEWAEEYWWQARAGVERIRKLDGVRLDALALKLAVTADAVAAVRGGYRRNAEDFVELLCEAAEGGAIGDEDAATLEDARRMYCISRREAAELATKHWEHARAADGNARALGGWIAASLTTVARARDEAAKLDTEKRAKAEADSKERAREAEARARTELEEKAASDALASKILAIAAESLEGAQKNAEAVAVLVEASRLNPHDPEPLRGLLGLYRDSGQWSRAVEVVQRISDLESDSARKATYAYDIASIHHEHLKDIDRALRFYNQALDLDPLQQNPFAMIREILTARKDWKGLERAYRSMLYRISGMPDSADLEFNLLNALGLICRDRLDQPNAAFRAFQLTSERKPEDLSVHEIVAKLAARIGNVEAAIAHWRTIAQQDLGNVEAMQSLYDLYCQSHQHDKALCAAATATFLLRDLTPVEIREFFEQHRPRGPLQPTGRLADEHWIKHLFHPDEAPVIGKIFAAILGTVRRAKVKPLQQFGFTQKELQAPQNTTVALVRSLAQSSQALNLLLPSIFLKPQQQGGLGYVPSEPIASFAGAGLLSGLRAEELAFVAAKHLSYYRNEHYIRVLLPTTKELKIMLLAAIKLVKPDQNVPADAVQAAHQLGLLLEQNPGASEALRNAVNSLLEHGNSPDIKKWYQSVELTAVRAGFLMCGDLEAARKLIAMEPTLPEDPGPGEKLKHIVRFSMSEDYFELRQQLGVAIP